MQSCKKEKSVNKEGFFWQGTYNTRGKTYLKEGALPGSLVDVRTPHAEDILALVHLVEGHEHAVCFFFFHGFAGYVVYVSIRQHKTYHFTKVLALLDIPPAERVSVLQRLVGELRVAVHCSSGTALVLVCEQMAEVCRQSRAERRTLRVDLLSGGQGEVFVCDGELCGGGGEAGSNGSDARCCWAGCAEEGWGKHGGRMRVSVSV